MFFPSCFNDFEILLGESALPMFVAINFTILEKAL
jgi:hypothetical protein